MWPWVEPLRSTRCCFLRGWLRGRIFAEHSAFRQLISISFVARISYLWHGFLHALLRRSWLESWLELMLLPHILRGPILCRLRFFRLDLLIFARLLINEAELVFLVWIVCITHCRWIKHIIPSAIIQSLIKLLLNSEVFILHRISINLLHMHLISVVFIVFIWHLLNVQSSIHFAGSSGIIVLHIKLIVMIVQLGKARVWHRKLILLVH